MLLKKLSYFMEVKFRNQNFHTNSSIPITIITPKLSCKYAYYLSDIRYYTERIPNQDKHLVDLLFIKTIRINLRDCLNFIF